MALISALLISVVLLILGISFLSYLEADYRFASRQDKSQQAYYLALAGLQYQRSRLDQLAPGATVIEQRHSLPASDPYKYFELKVYPDGRVESKGVVAAPLKILAERTLVVEPGHPMRDYRDSTRQ
jgi:type II secretory pathway component PulK